MEVTEVTPAEVAASACFPPTSFPNETPDARLLRADALEVPGWRILELPRPQLQGVVTCDSARGFKTQPRKGVCPESSRKIRDAIQEICAHTQARSPFVGAKYFFQILEQTGPIGFDRDCCYRPEQMG